MPNSIKKSRVLRENKTTSKHSEPCKYQPIKMQDSVERCSVTENDWKFGRNNDNSLTE